ncbi:MAG: hypothetical protein ABI054_13595, partial [Planctomycetota bacterium]
MPKTDRHDHWIISMLRELGTLGALLLASVCLASCAAQAPSTFELDAEWSPIASSTYGMEREPALVSVLDPGPAEARASYTWADIVPLLPPERTKPNDVWPVEVEPLLVFLRQLHPSATGELHHYVYQAPLSQLPPTVSHLQSRDGDIDVEMLRAQGVESVKVVNPQAPMGCYATLLRADSTLDVLLRVHAEFALVADRVLFTPAQFEARLVVDPRARRVVSFSLAVP